VLIVWTLLFWPRQGVLPNPALIAEDFKAWTTSAAAKAELLVMACLPPALSMLWQHMRAHTVPGGISILVNFGIDGFTAPYLDARQCSKLV
jgi:hypothetical protein